MTGLRFDFHQMPQGTTGGLSLYPVSGVLSGLVVSSPGIGGSNNIMTVNVSAGIARLDGKRVELATAITALQIDVGTGINLNTANLVTQVWLRPRRKVPALLAAPGSPAAGDKYIKVLEIDDYQLVDSIQEFKNSAWTLYNAAYAPPAIGHNNLPLNEQVEVISALTSANPSFSASNEKIVYHRDRYPIGVSSPGSAYLRYPAGVRLATISFTGGVGTVTSGIIEVDRISV